MVEQRVLPVQEVRVVVGTLVVAVAVVEEAQLVEQVVEVEMDMF